MAKFKDCITSLTNFSVIAGNINLSAMEQLTINIKSNGVNHRLVLIKPWPPLYRVNHTQLDKVRGLFATDIESVCPVSLPLSPSPSDKPGIQIAMKNEDWITIHCDSIELL